MVLSLPPALISLPQMEEEMRSCNYTFFSEKGGKKEEMETTAQDRIPNPRDVMYQAWNTGSLLEAH